MHYDLAYDGLLFYENSGLYDKQKRNRHQIILIGVGDIYGNTAGPGFLKAANTIMYKCRYEGLFRLAARQLPLNQMRR